MLMFLKLPFSRILHILSLTLQYSMLLSLTVLLTMKPVPNCPFLFSGPLYIRLYSFLSILPWPCHLISCSAITSNLYLIISFATSCIFPACNKVLTFQVASFKSLASRFIRCPEFKSVSKFRVRSQFNIPFLFRGIC
uniref:Uncharacterized protein n=1 Tax=Cacopsylla melanoneura TaxID=428564 RepID=A0A8D9F512_9HEMI